LLQTIMNNALLDYFRCPDYVGEIDVSGNVSSSSEPGFFRFGEDTICYGPYLQGSPSRQITHHMIDASQAVSFDQARVRLPFDLDQVVDNLRGERYMASSARSLAKITGGHASRRIYYALRPLLPVPVRKHLQRIRLSGWERIVFPHWPVDFTVDSLMARMMALALKAHKARKIPFIWFWPNGVPSSVVMTHDVEAVAGRDFCGELMNLDDSFGIKSAFEIVPEVRYGTHNGFLDSFRKRGFEINVHDLNHDGSLFHEKEEFLRRAKQINRYAKQFGTLGFRSGAMYRNQDWYGAFDFSYDMSVPNAAHLEPQRGGCCTVMPYFIGKILELPLTTTQDYSLFHILGDYSIELWKQQIELILQRNGLISFITHPDYLIEKRARGVYLDLLSHLARLRAEKKLWIALPGELNRWWRNRHQMRLVRERGGWRIEGPDQETARVAYAHLDGDRLRYSLDTTS
jgi:hypothetical protein